MARATVTVAGTGQVIDENVAEFGSEPLAVAAATSPAIVVMIRGALGDAALAILRMTLFPPSLM